MSSLKRIRTASAPGPTAAYEQAIVCGDLIFVSGQVGSDPTTGKISVASLGGQVAQALRNIEAIVEAAGGNRSTIVRCGVFLADLADFAEMNRAYAEFFGDRVPARTTVQAGLGALRVEIDAIAFRDASACRPASRIRVAAKSRR
jgi:2-iminobutanoate/2-iminopropanoate deaminase